MTRRVFERNPALSGGTAHEPGSLEPDSGPAVAPSSCSPGQSAQLPPRPSWGSRAGRVAAAVWLLGATVLFVTVCNRFYPFSRWLFLRHLHGWAFSAVFVGASLIAGHRLLTWTLTVPPKLVEGLLFCFSLGVLLFATGVSIAGFVGCLGEPFFFAWPLMMMAFGARSAWHTGRRIWSHTRQFDVRLFLPGRLLEALAFGLIVLSCLVLYLQVLTPANIGGDAQGYHFPIAEHYVAAGKIRAFSEGWYLGAYPQLASLLYTWAFLSPGSPSLHMALAMQIEWVIFLATLVGVASLARRLANRRLPCAPAVMFLFPGIFLYDSNLVGTADHVLAFWTVPLALALLSLSRRFEPREGALAGLMLAGGALTKYQGSFLVVASGVTLLVLTLRARQWKAPLAFALTAIVATSSHWLKNWCFYGNPVYPFASRLFPSHPFHAGALQAMHSGPVPDWVIGSFGPDMFKVLFAFSFLRDGNFGTAAAPLFGSLFTLLLPLLIFLRAPRRLWFVVFLVHLCLVVWWLTFHHDRFLQIMLPVMAASTAALLVLAWDAGAVVRVLTAALVGIQFLWGADTYFFREHGWAGDNPLKRFVDHVAMGHEGHADLRDAPVGSLVELGTKLPPHSRLLVHDLNNGQLGARSQIVNDALGWQGAISYVLLDSPRATEQLWQKLGVTHTVWYPDREPMSLERLASEMVYRRAILEYGEDLGTVAGRRYFALTRAPRHANLAGEPTRIAWLACGRDAPTGIYTMNGILARRTESPLSESLLKTAPLQTLAQANAILARSDCPEANGLDSALRTEFVETGRSQDFQLWVRIAPPHVPER